VRPVPGGDVKTILLVDDSPAIRDLIKVYLIDKELRVLDARDGVEALAVARSQRPDLVLCDLRMPRLDGPGLCRELRADARLWATPVVILTASQDQATLQRCREAGAYDVLLKPIGSRPLLEAVLRTTGIEVGRSSPPARRQVG
jgi:CheY-like chemotaxis protein